MFRWIDTWQWEWVFGICHLTSDLTPTLAHFEHRNSFDDPVATRWLHRFKWQSFTRRNSGLMHSSLQPLLVRLSLSCLDLAYVAVERFHSPRFFKQSFYSNVAHLSKRWPHREIDQFIHRMRIPNGIDSRWDVSFRRECIACIVHVFDISIRLDVTHRRILLYDCTIAVDVVDFFLSFIAANFVYQITINAHKICLFTARRSSNHCGAVEYLYDPLRVCACESIAAI